MKTKRTNRARHAREGATLVLVVFLLSVFMVAIAFSVDLARVQLAQIELQSIADLSARAGAEAIARGVGASSDTAVLDTAIREEIAMIAELNRAGGAPIDLANANDIAFGYGTEDADTMQFNPTVTGGSYDEATSAVRVHPRLSSFPMFFGAFVGTDSLGLSKQAAASVQERDIVLVLDRSASMLDHDAGTVSTSHYNPNLLSLQDDMYGPGDRYFGNPGLRHSEFEITGSTMNLSKMQALLQVVFNFRKTIDASRGHEQLGLVTYAEFADHPRDATTATGPVDIAAGLAPSLRSSIVGTGITDPVAHKYASALESHTTGYRNFDYQYLAMRWQEQTNISDGIAVGTEVLYGPGHRPFAKPIMVLMADGRHTMPGSPEDTLTAAMAAHPDMTLFTVSFGENADTDLMSRLATAGGGQWYHATDFATLNATFDEIARTAGVMLNRCGARLRTPLVPMEQSSIKPGHDRHD